MTYLSILTPSTTNKRGDGSRFPFFLMLASVWNTVADTRVVFLGPSADLIRYRVPLRGSSKISILVKSNDAIRNQQG